MSRREYARGTYLDTTTRAHQGEWYSGGRALCTDGRVRNLHRISPVADSFFSVPAAVKVKGKTVGGFVMVETIAGYDTPTDDDPAVVKFTPYQYGVNGHMLPRRLTATEIRREQ